MYAADEVYEKPFQVSIRVDGVTVQHKRLPLFHSDRHHNR